MVSSCCCCLHSIGKWTSQIPSVGLTCKFNKIMAFAPLNYNHLKDAVMRLQRNKLY
uniref:Uncharacterized protein n=1 Tax=Rhizophora mucronata TaxID=61149 RepID=A0A2P2Q5H7_RHIMU